MNGTLTVASPSGVRGLTSPAPYRVRPATKDDAAAIREFICGLSVRTQYFRFFTAVSPPSPGLLRALTGNERADVLLVTEESGAIIGHGMAVDADTAGELCADIGLVVADNWQGKGVGTTLLGLLTRRAAARGVVTLVLDVLPDNARMLGIIERRWPGASRKRTLDAVVIRARIAGHAADSREGPVPVIPVSPAPPPPASAQLAMEATVSQADQQPKQPSEGVAVNGRQRTYAWDDPAVAAAAARELAGEAFFAKLTSGELPVPPVAATLGFAAVSVRDGVATFELDPSEFHYNPIGSVHGGVIATLCDSACGCAVHSLLPAGTGYTSLDLNVKFLRPVTAATGRLRCDGTVLHLGSRSALAQATLTGPDGKLYAQATSSCMIFRPTAG